MASVIIFKKTGYSVLTVICMFSALLAALQCPARGESPKVARSAAIPAWVKPQAVDVSLPASNDQVGDGIWDLLVDEQTNVREAADYEHYASKYLSENGVQEGSRITITFDPAYESLTLNKLVVYRDGKAIDRLMSQEIKLLQREEGLDRQLYDGRLSAVMLLEDIRVGDTVEYAYTIRGENPIFNGDYFDSFYFSWDSPLHRLYQRILWPSGRKLAIKSFVEDFPPVVTKSGPFTEYTWEKTDVPPLISDGDLPSWYDPYGWVQLSEFQTWGDVARWAMKFDVVPDKAPENLREEIALLAPIGDAKTKVIAALRFVQKNIRYLGIEVGAHSHKPYPIATVLQRRFGDCKDKALLLCALLRQLGFEAYPAMVDTDYRQSISQWLPSPLVFDHVVVQLRLDGRIYWLDPTRSDQGGGLDELYFPAYGDALVVKDDTDSLTKITPGGFDAVGTEITESYSFADYKGDAKLNVHSVFRGRDAESTRAWLADTSHEEIEKEYLNYYAKQHQDIHVAKSPVFTDDFEKNEIVCDESYVISHFWEPHSDNPDRLFGDFYPHSLRDIITKPDTELRSMPLAVPYPDRMVETLKISLPEGIKFTSDQLNIDDQAFKFAYQRSFDKNEVTLRYSYETLEDHVDTGRVPEYLKNVNKLLDNMDYEVSCNKDSVEAPASTPAPANPPVAAATPVTAPQPPSNLAYREWPMFFPFVFLGVFWLFRALGKRQRTPAVGADPDISLHRCAFCGKTELSAPDTEFRVAMDGEEYCNLHLPKIR